MIRVFILFLICILSAGALAQTAKQPLEVTADKTLEWDRTNKTFTARQNAIAKQGASELHGDVLVAKYTEGANGKGGGMNVNRIDATGHVTVVSDGSRATGNKGFYTIRDGYAELTGGDLKIETKSDVVTARDKITYSTVKREMNAYGNARATRGDDIITADRLIGRFVADAGGGSKMDQMEAVGNVVITTPTEILYGDRALYLTGPNTATVTGNVRIEKGPNVIEGARGEIDLNTNISKIYGGADAASGNTSGDGRVRGVFYADE